MLSVFFSLFCWRFVSTIFIFIFSFFFLFFIQELSGQVIFWSFLILHMYLCCVFLNLYKYINICCFDALYLSISPREAPKQYISSPMYFYTLDITDTT